MAHILAVSTLVVTATDHCLIRQSQIKTQSAKRAVIKLHFQTRRSKQKKTEELCRLTFQSRKLIQHSLVFTPLWPWSRSKSASWCTRAHPSQAYYQVIIKVIKLVCKCKVQWRSLILCSFTCGTSLQTSAERPRLRFLPSVAYFCTQHATVIKDSLCRILSVHAEPGIMPDIFQSGVTSIRRWTRVHFNW